MQQRPRTKASGLVSTALCLPLLAGGGCCSARPGRIAGELANPSISASIEKAQDPAGVISELVGVRIELSGPRQPTCVWGASEWMLRFENHTVDPLPCSDHVLEPAGHGGAAVTFEISRAGQALRTFASKYSRSTNCARPARGELVEPGGTRELPAVLHGEMRRDLAAYGRGERFETFHPAFDSPGSYSVTAELRWNGRRIRSNPVALEVAAAPPGAERARTGLEELAASGVCVDVQGMGQDLSTLEPIAAFVEREGHTLYGAQLQLGLTRALLGIVQSQAVDFSERLEPLATDRCATLKRVKSLLPTILPAHFGLDRSLERLRADIEAEGRRVL
jgi:hypothetical protein